MTDGRAAADYWSVQPGWTDAFGRPASYWLGLMQRTQTESRCGHILPREDCIECRVRSVRQFIDDRRDAAALGGKVGQAFCEDDARAGGLER